MSTECQREKHAVVITKLTLGDPGQEGFKHVEHDRTMRRDAVAKIQPITRVGKSYALDRLQA